MHDDAQHKDIEFHYIFFITNVYTSGTKVYHFKVIICALWGQIRDKDVPFTP